MLDFIQNIPYINSNMAKTNFVTWSSTFSVGIALIDDQHKELLKLTNDLYSHCVGDVEEEKAFFKKVIKAAVDYVKVHFATEEKIMIRTAFPGYAEHKRQHDSFILNVVDAIKNFEESKKPSLLIFTNFLKDWVLTHIAVSDKQYFQYFRQIATRKTDGSLSIKREDIPTR